MTEYEDLKPFFDEMLAMMQKHDHNKGDSWRKTEKYMAYNLRTKFWEEFTECIEFNEIENTKNPHEFVDLANICAMIWLRAVDEAKLQRSGENTQ